MKKMLALMIVAIFVIVAVPAMAADLKIGGDYRIRGFVENDFDYNDQASDNAQYYDMRLRLFPEIVVNDAVKVNIEMEINSNGTWGTTEGTNVTTVGTPPTNTVTRDDDITVTRAYATIKLPAKIGTLIAGRQRVDWGHGFMCYDATADRYKLVNTTLIDGVTLVAAMDKVAENTTDVQDDTNKYVLAGIKKIGTTTVGLLLIDAYTQQGAALDTEKQIIDLDVSGSAGKVNYGAEIVMAMGDAGLNNDYDELGAMVQASIDAGKVTVGLEVGYASGQDTSADDTEFASDDDWEPAEIMFAGGVTNAMYYKLSAAMDINDKLSGDVAVIMATADETVAYALPDDDGGIEIDVHATYKLADNCDLNLTAAYHMPGDAYGTGADDATLLKQEICIKF